MTVSNNTIQAEGICSCFEKMETISAKTGKKLATNVLNKPGRALEITSNIATAAATKSSKACHHYLKYSFFTTQEKGLT